MRPTHIWAVLIVAILQSCATQFPQTNYQTQELTPYLENVEEIEADYAEEDVINPTGTISIERAASLVLLQNPGLSAYPYEIRAQEASAMQAGLRPNPEFEADFEDFAGSGDFGFGDRIEVTTFYSQLIERGGKREKRYQLGLWKAEMSRWDYRTAKVNVLALLARRYLDVLAEQERVAILQELVGLSEQALYAISERVRAGRVSPLEETRAKVELASERNALDMARQDLASAKTLLASVWGAAQSQFENVSGRLEQTQSFPELDILLAKVENNPDIQRWATEMQRRQSALELEQAQAVPDITLTGGIRYLNESEDATLVGAISIPFKIFDRNQGAIRAAQERLGKTRLGRETAIIDLQSNLASVYQRLQGTQMEIKRLQEEIIPGSEQAYDAAREGYREGEFDYLDVLDAQRTLFESRVQYVQSLARFHQQWIAVERLIGQPLHDNLQTIDNEVKP